MIEQTKETKGWQYRITGYYYADDEKKRFDEVLFAEDVFKAMEQIIGKYTLKESLNNKAFKLDAIHYDCY